VAPSYHSARVHALVLLRPGTNRTSAEELQADHERFIDGLIEQKRVVLGGDWLPPIAGFEAGYLLSCASLDEAREIAASDPFVRDEAMRSEVVEWQLVGVDPDAVDRESLLYPDLTSGQTSSANAATRSSRPGRS
jgi:uncharacterized protein YciI